MAIFWRTMVNGAKGPFLSKFIPAFRNGQPVESNVKIPVYYKPSA